MDFLPALRVVIRIRGVLLFLATLRFLDVRVAFLPTVDFVFAADLVSAFLDTVFLDDAFRETSAFLTPFFGATTLPCFLAVTAFLAVDFDLAAAWEVLALFFTTVFADVAGLADTVANGRAISVNANSRDLRLKHLDTFFSFVVNRRLFFHFTSAYRHFLPLKLPDSLKKRCSCIYRKNPVFQAS